MAHTLQLTVLEGILSQCSIADITASGKRIVGHFKHFQLAYSRLQSIQKQLGQPIKRPQQDLPGGTVYIYTTESAGTETCPLCLVLLQGRGLAIGDTGGIPGGPTWLGWSKIPAHFHHQPAFHPTSLAPPTIFHFTQLEQIQFALRPSKRTD